MLKLVQLGNECGIFGFVVAEIPQMQASECEQVGTEASVSHERSERHAVEGKVIERFHSLPVLLHEVDEWTDESRARQSSELYRSIIS